ncbi:hypothetical protein LCGC14_3008800, partial [marine sediment metagenome]
GRTALFESVHLGSNPSPAAMRDQLAVGCDSLKVVTMVRIHLGVLTLF